VLAPPVLAPPVLAPPVLAPPVLAPPVLAPPVLAPAALDAPPAIAVPPLAIDVSDEALELQPARAMAAPTRASPTPRNPSRGTNVVRQFIEVSFLCADFGCEALLELSADKRGNATSSFEFSIEQARPLARAETRRLAASVRCLPGSRARCASSASAHAQPIQPMSLRAIGVSARARPSYSLCRDRSGPNTLMPPSSAERWRSAAT
jgi:hypothetical protein